MHPVSFSCPHCSATLRVKDRRYVGQQVKCPDCREPLQIVADGRHGLFAEPADTTASDGPATAKTARKSWRRRAAMPAQQTADPVPQSGATLAVEDRPTGATRWERWWALLTSPVGIAWTVALGALLLFVLLVGPFGAADAVDPQQTVQAETAGSTAADDPSPKKGDRPRVPAPREPRAARGPGAAKIRLTELGQHVLDYSRRHGRFPTGTVYADGVPPRDRFGWLAQLAADTLPDGDPQPLWDRGWRDGLNERFVRRSIPLYQNPAIASLAGADGYPASHFVGMAGVGEDAARLPIGHRRAGVFGMDRRTRLEDIRDGAANTILLAGVTNNLSAWAAGGTGTVRALTREPYVNGPDGFGTGQTESMLVLMADGSVRRVARETDPRLLRRMAAMADGLPLDLSIPGEPGDATAPTAPVKIPDDDPPVVARLPTGVDRPGLQPTPRMKVDVAAALRQRVSAYLMKRPVPLRAVLREVEEMAGVPIRFSPESIASRSNPLEKAVLIELQNPTVADILRALLRQAELEYEIRPDAIYVRASAQK